MARLQQIFEDLMSRFIINVPESEISDPDRICFQIEQAHWFYEDFIREDDRSLPGFTLKRFAAEMFQRCPLLKDFLVESNMEEIYKRFLALKMNIPVCGAIILNTSLDKVLMVRGWTSSSSWMFPKGKINKDEEECACAIREVLEETGFDCSSVIDPDVYIEIMMRGEQRNRLYIITNISETTEFCPRTRKEIGDIKWHWLIDLPGYRQGKKVNKQEDLHTKYFMISKIVVELQKWLSKNKKSIKKKLKTNDSASFSGDNQAKALKSILGLPSAGRPIVAAHDVAAIISPLPDESQTSALTPTILQPYENGTKPGIDTEQHRVDSPNQHRASLLSILKHGSSALFPATHTLAPSELLGPSNNIILHAGDRVLGSSVSSHAASNATPRQDLLHILLGKPQQPEIEQIHELSFAKQNTRQTRESAKAEPPNTRRKKKQAPLNHTLSSKDNHEGTVKILKRPQSAASDDRQSNDQPQDNMNEVFVRYGSVEMLKCVMYS